MAKKERQLGPYEITGWALAQAGRNVHPEPGDDLGPLSGAKERQKTCSHKYQSRGGGVIGGTKQDWYCGSCGLWIE